MNNDKINQLVCQETNGKIYMVVGALMFIGYVIHILTI